MSVDNLDEFLREDGQIDTSEFGELCSIIPKNVVAALEAEGRLAEIYSLTLLAKQIKEKDEELRDARQERHDNEREKNSDTEQYQDIASKLESLDGTASMSMMADLLLDVHKNGVIPEKKKKIFDETDYSDKSVFRIAPDVSCSSNRLFATFTIGDLRIRAGQIGFQQKDPFIQMFFGPKDKPESFLFTDDGVFYAQPESFKTRRDVGISRENMTPIEITATDSVEMLTELLNNVPNEKTRNDLLNCFNTLLVCAGRKTVLPSKDSRDAEIERLKSQLDLSLFLHEIEEGTPQTDQRNENARLRAENARLQSENNKLKEENEDLKSEVDRSNFRAATIFAKATEVIGKIPFFKNKALREFRAALPPATTDTPPKTTSETQKKSFHESIKVDPSKLQTVQKPQKQAEIEPFDRSE